MYIYIYIYIYSIYIVSGVSRISFGGEVQNIFVKVGVFAWHVAKPRVFYYYYYYIYL